MEHQSTVGLRGRVIQISIVGYWSLFWLLNVIDKFIGAPDFLFVGTDRFALFVKLFSSLGIASLSLPLAALATTTLFETATFVLSGAALFYLLVRDDEKARAFFFWSTSAGLTLFGFFMVGDNVFGDRTELLEHSTYWTLFLISWAAYIYLPRQETAAEIKRAVSKTSMFVAIAAIAIGSMFVIGAQSISGIQSIEQVKMIGPVPLGNGIYSFEAPFIATGEVWQESLAEFTREHPDLRIINFYTVPKEFGRAKATNVVVWVITEEIK